MPTTTNDVTLVYGGGGHIYEECQGKPFVL